MNENSLTLSDDKDNAFQERKSRKRIVLYSIIAILLCLSALVLIFVLQSSQHLTLRILEDQSSILSEKEQYEDQLRRYFDDDWQFDGLKLAESNFQYSPSPTPALRELEEGAYSRLNDEYHFDEFPKELPFCIIVQRLNILDNFSYEFTLNSIFNQNYSNFKAIILHEPETKGFKMVQEYLKTRNIDQAKYIHVQMKAPKSILRAIYDASHEHCHPGSISFPIHRSGELIGKNVLKVYNVLYQINKVGLIYSDYYRYSRNKYVKAGANYHSNEQRLNNIRRQIVFITNAVTYRTDFFLSIPKEELLGNGYNYYDNVYEQALFFPLVEKMCGIVFKIDGFYLLTKQPFQTYSEYLQFVEGQKENSDMFRNKAKFPCNQTYIREAKGSFFIKSLNRKYLQASQLAQVSRKNVQPNAVIKHSETQPIFEGNPKKKQTREADRYIYNGSHEIVEAKREYEMARADYCDLSSDYGAYQNAKFNLFLGEGIDEQYNELRGKYDAAAEKLHQLSHYSKYEVPLCVIVAELPSRVGEYRFEYLLNSIFAQEYSNFFVVINNRNPTLDKFVRKYLHHYQIATDRYTYIQRPHTYTPLEAIHSSLTSVCHSNSYAMILSGKEELLGRKAFKIFSSKFRSTNYNLLYAAGFTYNQEGKSTEAQTTENYTFEERKGNLYRKSAKKFSYVVAFMTKMFSNVRIIDLQDGDGQFLESNWDEALLFPLLQLSCSQNSLIEGGHYIKHRDLDTNTHNSNNEISLRIRNLQKYPCFQDKYANVNQIYGKLPTIDQTNKRMQKQGAIRQLPYRHFDLLQTNSKGEGVVDYVYSTDESVKAQRESYQRQKERASQKVEGNTGIQLSMLNVKLDHAFDEVEKVLMEEDYRKMVAAVNFSTSQQQPICAVVDLKMQGNRFQFEYTLNSLFLQNYTNFFAVIFGDGSENGKDEVRRYLEFYQIPPERYAYLPNQAKSHGIENIVAAAQSYCSRDSLMVYLRQSDEFVGRNVLKMLSRTHQKQHSYFIYSNYFLYDSGVFQEMMTQVGQKDRSIRKAESFRLSFAAFTADLFRKVDVANFKDAQGNYYQLAIEKALYLPMIELACTKATELKGAHFLKTGNTDSNSENLKSQLKEISQKQSYSCLNHP